MPLGVSVATIEVRAAIRRCICEENMTRQQTADLLNISLGTVRRYAIGLDIHKRYKQPSKYDRAVIAQLKAKGYTHKQIAYDLKCPHRQIIDRIVRDMFTACR